MPFAVHLVDHPHVAGDGDFLAGGRRSNERADLLRFAAYAIFLVLLEYRVELEVTGDALPRHADDQAAAFSGLDMVDPNQVAQEDPVIVLRDAFEHGERKHLGCQLRRCHLTS